jgi:uncharacterized membrane protein YeaQ/YmgE (transglycosylase-associated protein family)
MRAPSHWPPLFQPRRDEDASHWVDTRLPDLSQNCRDPSLMGWTGIAILGAAIGVVGWWLHPLRNGARRGVLGAMIAGVTGAVLANAAGRLTGAFFDGELLQWPVCTVVALVATAVIAGLSFRQGY